MGPWSRRRFLIEFGKGTTALVLLGPVAAACGSEPRGNDGTPEAASSSSTSSSSLAATTIPANPTTTEAQVAPESSGDTRWERVLMSNVSAYILVRNSKAVIVDAGHAGLIDDIEAGLQRVGVAWADVGDVILTHMHSDHIGGLPAVMERATSATAHAGEPDIEAMQSPRPLSVVADGDEVVGLRIIGTPGHTPGHVCVLDSTAGILVAGDALNESDGEILGASSRFSSDMTAANESVKKLATFDYSTILMGHGDPITSNGSQMVADLSSTL
ncbi:MAG: MBL fold metallo-hydrolase [Acidimicrobiia bacterium]|nr:MBL fold metallo-hydrolase [Acidimicrobiia bacterium]